MKDDVLEKIEALLAEERAAIRRLDARAVEALAVEKGRLFDALAALPAAALEGAAPRVRAVVSDLRRNGVLLAHARDCLRDALGLAPGKRGAVRLSVTG